MARAQTHGNDFGIAKAFCPLQSWEFSVPHLAEIRHGRRKILFFGSKKVELLSSLFLLSFFEMFRSGVRAEYISWTT